MASVKRPTVIRYVLRVKDDAKGRPAYASRVPGTGERVTAETPGAVKLKRKSKVWHGSWRGEGGSPTPYVSLKTANKADAQRIVAERERVALLQAQGLLPKEAGERARPLADHLEDYRRHLESKNRAAAHVSQVINQCAAVLNGCKFKLIGDVDGDKVLDFLAGLRRGRSAPQLDANRQYTTADAARLAGIKIPWVRRHIKLGKLQATRGLDARSRPAWQIGGEQLTAWLAEVRGGIGAETSNHYLRSARQFFRWLRRKVQSNPMEDVEFLNAATDRRLRRRALTLDECARLLAAAAVGEPSHDLTGPQRRLLYHVALRTGLRAGELASLTPLSFNAERRTLTVDAGHSKRRRRDVVELRADVAAELVEYCRGRAADAPLWPGRWVNGDAAEMLRVDLAAAGIPYTDAAGEVADFHALRHSFISQLVEAGVPMKRVQELARHSTITLTMDRYCHLQKDVNPAADVEKLPGIGG